MFSLKLCDDAHSQLSCTHAACPGRSVLIETDHQNMGLCVCVTEKECTSTQHSNPAAFVCLTYNLQNDPICKSAASADRAPVSPSPVPVGCVRMSAAHAQVCVCVCVSLLAGSVSPTLEVDRKRNLFFSFAAQLGVADKQDVSHSFSWLELPGERSLIVDTEKEHCVISPLWPMTCLETSRESSYIVGGTDPETTRLDFWRNSWLLCLFLCLFEPDCLIDWQLQTCYCSHTNTELEWHTADSGHTPVRITAGLPLDRNWIFTFQLNLPASWWKGFVCDRSSEAHMVATTCYS